MRKIVFLVDVEGRPLKDFMWLEGTPPSLIFLPALGKNDELERRKFFKRDYREFKDTVIYLYTEWEKDSFMDRSACGLLDLYAHMREFFEEAGVDIS